MANALCTQCGKTFRYPSQRGTRLANYVSPCCNAPGKRGGERVKAMYQSVLCDYQTAYWLTGNWYTVSHKSRFGYKDGGMIFCKRDAIYYPLLESAGEWIELWQGTRPEYSPQLPGGNSNIRIKAADWERIKTCEPYTERVWNRGEYQVPISV